MRGLEQLRRLSEARDQATERWRDEIVRASEVYSVRAIADAAGVSHTQVWRMVKGSE